MSDAKQIPCPDCGLPMENVGNGIGYACLDDASPCRKLTEGEKLARVMNRYARPTPTPAVIGREEAERLVDAFAAADQWNHEYQSEQSQKDVDAKREALLTALLSRPLPPWATGEFTPEFALYNMLLAWTPNQLREFYAMLSRRPDFAPTEALMREAREFWIEASEAEGKTWYGKIYAHDGADRIRFREVLPAQAEPCVVSDADWGAIWQAMSPDATKEEREKGRTAFRRISSVQTPAKETIGDQSDSPMGLLPYGYAPGGYMNNCQRCRESFTGDKRAITCQPCAMALWDRDREAQASPAPSDLESAAYAVIDQASLPTMETKYQVREKAVCIVPAQAIEGLRKRLPFVPRWPGGEIRKVPAAQASLGDRQEAAPCAPSSTPTTITVTAVLGDHYKGWGGPDFFTDLKFSDGFSWRTLLPKQYAAALISALDRPTEASRPPESGEGAGT